MGKTPAGLLRAVESGSTVSKKAFAEVVEPLRLELVNAQYDLHARRFGVVILIMGDDRIGCEHVIDVLHEWMESRYIDTHAFAEPSDEESERPRFWRYWRALPAHGRIGVYFGAWHLRALADRVDGRLDDAAFQRRLDHIERFERALVDDGTLVLKFWLHLPKKEHQKRLANAKKHPRKLWYIDPADRRVYEDYDRIVPVAEEVLRQTGTGEAPWTVVESTDDRHCSLTVARTILSALQLRLATAEAPPSLASTPAVAAPVGNAPLDGVDLERTLEREAYRARLKDLQGRLHRLVDRAAERGVTTVLAFEGWDAAGKGGVIRRITNPISAFFVNVVPIAAPTDEERARHYLWRFWRHLPRAGRMLIFDRTWYGRVLVERVEGFARPDEWRRAYSEINDFEEQLVEHGIILRKFWLHLDADEQLRRFQAREETPYKQHKITDEDYRNRERWDAYADAVNEMVTRTSTADAPWTLVPANDKRYARIAVLESVCDALARRVKGKKD